MYLNQLFSTLLPNEVVDLSKTLIQTTGILVSLIAASAFFYAGRLEQLAVSYLREANQLVTDITRSENEATECVEATEIAWQEWPKICRSCVLAKKCQSKNKMKEDMEGFTETIKKYDEQIKELVKTSKEFPKQIAENVRVAIKIDTAYWIVAVAILLWSTLIAVIAYVNKSPKALLASVDFIAVGMIGIITSWIISYYISELLREGFHGIINVTSNINSLLFNLRSYRKAIDLEELKRKIRTHKEKRSNGG